MLNNDLAGYKFYHANGESNAGGVAIYIKDYLESDVYDEPFTIHDGSKNLFLRVQSAHKVYIIGVVYCYRSYIAYDLEF